MKFADFSIQDYTQALASEFPTPGGGTTAALCAALGASFIAMVARIAMTKPSCADSKINPAHIADDAEMLRQQFLAIMDSDTEAYNAILAINVLPQKTASEKSAYHCAKQKALQNCAEQPLNLLKLCRDALRLAHTIADCFYKPTASDLALAAGVLQSASQGAYLTVRINLNHIDDSVFVMRVTNESSAIFDEAMSLAHDVFSRASNLITG
jgi:glutamate formiminotransferase/formiminotetrahydrofolate cyclodeaminase